MGLTLTKHNAGDLLVASVVNSNWTAIENKFNTDKILLTELKTPYYVRDWAINRKITPEWNGAAHVNPLLSLQTIEFYLAVRKSTDITNERLYLLYFMPTYISWTGAAPDHGFEIKIEKADFIVGAYTVVYTSPPLASTSGTLIKPDIVITLNNDTTYKLILKNLSAADDIISGNINITTSFKSYLRE